MAEKSLDLLRSVVRTPIRERLSREDGITRRLNAEYWRHHAHYEHNERGLLAGGPDEFSGNLHDFIADSLAGATTEDPRAALARMRSKRINARNKARARDAFVKAVLARAGVPFVRGAA